MITISKATLLLLLTFGSFVVFGIASITSLNSELKEANSELSQLEITRNRNLLELYDNFTNNNNLIENTFQLQDFSSLYAISQNDSIGLIDTILLDRGMSSKIDFNNVNVFIADLELISKTSELFRFPYNIELVFYRDGSPFFQFMERIFKEDVIASGISELTIVNKQLRIPLTGRIWEKGHTYEYSIQILGTTKPKIYQRFNYK